MTMPAVSIAAAIDRKCPEQRPITTFQSKGGLAERNPPLSGESCGVYRVAGYAFG